MEKKIEDLGENEDRSTAKARALAIVLGLVALGLVVWLIFAYNGKWSVSEKLGIQITSLMAATNGLGGQVDALQKAGVALTNQVKDLQSTKTALVDTNTALTSEVEALQAVTNSLGRQFDALKQEAINQINSLRQATNSLGRQVDGLKTATNSLIGRVEALQAATNGLGGEITALQTTNSALAEKVAALQAESKTNAVPQLVLGPTSGSAKGRVPVLLVNQGTDEANVTLVGKRGDFTEKVDGKSTATINVPPGQYNWSGPNGSGGVVRVDDVATHHYPGEGRAFAGRVVIAK